MRSPVYTGGLYKPAKNDVHFLVTPGREPRDQYRPHEKFPHLPRISLIYYTPTRDTMARHPRDISVDIVGLERKIDEPDLYYG